MKLSKFAIITHVAHIHQNSEYLGYAPYIGEMNIWLKYTNEVVIVAPLKKGNPTAIDAAYDHKKIQFRKVPDFNFTNFSNLIKSIFKLPKIVFQIFSAMREADHIHLRCPGNMGLIGCLLQILFPCKIKTAKYAGNWDPKSKQPLTYRFQKYILANTFLTRNMKVLVYGEWPDQSKNIKSFFTASYSDLEKQQVLKINLSEAISFVFAGTLTKGKNPLYAVEVIKELAKKGYNVTLNIFGEGLEGNNIEKFILTNHLESIVFLHGNQSREILKGAYKKCHFVILPSQSEGWPKAIAEGMFWGCVPVATRISCVPFMLDFGKRGILLDMDIQSDINQLINILDNENSFLAKSKLASEWSQIYTTDLFDKEIKMLLQQ